MGSSWDDAKDRTKDFQILFSGTNEDITPLSLPPQCAFVLWIPQSASQQDSRNIFSIKVFLKPSEGAGAALWALPSSIMKCSRVKESSQYNPNYWETFTGNPIHLLHWLSNGILSNEAGHYLCYKGSKINQALQ